MPENGLEITPWEINMGVRDEREKKTRNLWVALMNLDLFAFFSCVFPSTPVSGVLINPIPVPSFDGLYRLRMIRYRRTYTWLVLIIFLDNVVCPLHLSVGASFHFAHPCKNDRR